MHVLDFITNNITWCYGIGSGNSADRRVLILKRLASSPVPQLEPANKGIPSPSLAILFIFLLFIPSAFK